MARKFRYTFAIFGALSGAWLARPVLAAQAQGTVAETRFSIPAGALGRSLQALATQSRLQILYAPELVEGQRARGLQATLSPQQALALLLEHSGLQAVPVNANTFLVQRLPDAGATPRPRRGASFDEPVEMATVQVTGTHIPRERLDVVSTMPSTLISRAQIEASGYQTLFEVLSHQPGMTSHHPVDVASEGAFQTQQPFAAAATASLYGLGPRATLFLVDGRRVANYGLASADLGGLTDLNGIPLSMIERIEIIRGGASAIYGADAMAGVVNIILKREQEGGEVVARYGLSDRGDTEQRRLSLSYGQDTASGGFFLLSADYFQRDALLGRDRDWRSSDLRRFGLGDWRLPLGYHTFDGELVQEACPPSLHATAGGCLFDRPPYITLQPRMESLAVYGYLLQPLTDSLDLRASVRLSQVDQSLQGAPIYGSVILPYGHPDDVDPGSPTYLNYVFFDIGPVRSRSRARTQDISIGLTGQRGNWQWQADLLHHRNDVDNRIDGLVRDSVFSRSIDELTYRFNVAGNPQALLAELSPQVGVKGEAALDQLVFGFNGPWFALPAGKAQAAIGIEISRDTLSNHPDALILEHDVALGAQKSHIDESRNSSALYAELSLPLAQRLLVDLAWRIDHRQGYGSESSPKLGLKWNVLDSLTLRATSATGYRAPSLFEMRRPSVIRNLDAVLETEVLAPCEISAQLENGTRYCLVDRGSIENPNLQPETSRSSTIGLVWAPSAALSLSLDYFQIRRRNEIVPIAAAGTDGSFPGSLVRDESGLLIAVNDYFDNIGRTDVSGWELQSEYRIESERHGRFTLRLSGSLLDQLRRQSDAGDTAFDYAGFGAPKRAVLAGVEWAYGDWTTALNLHGLGPVNVDLPGQPCPSWNAAVRKCRTPATSTADLYLAYAGIAGWRLSLNVNNLGDREPVNYDVGKGGYDIAFDDPVGRYYLVSAAYRF
ncbi:TonB-dependent receptor domain-containing protein [Lysobacter cavernae]|uniref:TonB-dependent receptor domain-containing protein n=1 Tax=Lysobacter cavernae TaxID=1685901 RepID=A0ABV7RLC1_9GAMM